MACSFPMAQLCFLLSGGASVLLASILTKRLWDGFPGPCSHFWSSKLGAPFKQFFPMPSHRGLGQSNKTLPSCSPVNRWLTLAPQPQKNSDTTRFTGSRSKVAYLIRGDNAPPDRRDKSKIVQKGRQDQYHDEHQNHCNTTVRLLSD